MEYNLIRSSLAPLAALLAPFAMATGPITWKANAITLADGNIQVSVQAACEEGWHIYALTLPRDDGPFPTSFKFAVNNSYALNGAVVEPAPQEVDDPNFQMKVRYHTGQPTFTAQVKRLSNEAFEINGEVEYMSCNDKTCLPPQVFKFSIPMAALK